MTENKKLAITYFVITLVIMIATFMISYSIGVNKNLENDSFYEVVKVNDSTIHMNISEFSCALVSIYEDTIRISTHNCYGVNYNKDYHDITIRSRSNDSIFMSTIDLDMWFNDVPNIPYFILDIN